MHHLRSTLPTLLLTTTLLLFAACGGASGADAGGDAAGGGTDTIAPALPDGGAAGDVGTQPKPDAAVVDSTLPPADVPPADVPSADTLVADVCQPDCGGRACGDDGCGGSCGDCGDGETCTVEGACEACTPDCTGRFCGWDGCGGSCGECADNERCTGLGRCQCIPECDGRACGDDGCGGVCGRCEFGWTCSEDGACLEPCIPDCQDGCCGDDGCGGQCADRCTAAGLTCDPETCSCGGDGPCGEAPVLGECETVSPAPSTTTDVNAFYLEYAVPLSCTDDDGASIRDLTVFGLDAADAQIFMFGEVHGSNEQGLLSADIFEYLVRIGRVNTLSMEIGVDMSDVMEQFVRTGGGPLAQSGWLEQLPRGLFLRALLERARLLALEGYDLRAFGADVPMYPTSALSVVQQLSTQLETTRDLVMPLPAQSGGGWVDRTEARSWRDRVLPNQDAICDELADETQCERFVQYTNAVWLSAVSSSGALYQLPNAQVEEFFSRREDFIYFAYRTHMPNETAVVFTHMGAAHTAKAESAAQGYAGVGARLETLYPVTAGRVYATTPAYGPGSRILYGQELYDLPPEPRALSTALASAPIDQYHVSTWRPSEACVGRPNLDLRMQDLWVPYRDAYDAFTWIRQLTPESGAFKSAVRAPEIRLFLERRDAIAAARTRLRAAR